MDFDTYLQNRGITAGTYIPPAQAKQLHAAWLKESGDGSSFQPQIVPVTNPITQEVSPAFMSSANSATLMRDSQPRTQYKPDKEGNLMAIEGTLASYVTNNTGDRIKVDPKSNNLADLMAAMGGGASAPMEEESPGVLSRIFGGVASSPAPTPTPTPEMQRPTGSAVPTGTNAPAPVAAPTPAVFSAADYQRMTGQTLPPGDYQDANGRPFSVR